MSSDYDVNILVGLIHERLNKVNTKKENLTTDSLQASFRKPLVINENRFMDTGNNRKHDSSTDKLRPLWNLSSLMDATACVRIFQLRGKFTVY